MAKPEDYRRYAAECLRMQCAWAAVKKKDSYLQAQFYRIKARSSEPRSLNAGGIPHPHSRKYEVESVYRARRLSNHLHLCMPAADRQRKTWIDFTANKLAWGFVHERSDKLELEIAAQARIHATGSPPVQCGRFVRPRVDWHDGQ